MSAKLLVTLALAVLVTVVPVSGRIYFQETFSDGEDYKGRWKFSNWHEDDGSRGEWSLSSGEWFGDEEADIGLYTSENFRYWAISSELPETFDNRYQEKSFVLQFSVKHTQMIECGGGRIKVFGKDIDPGTLSNETPFLISFGPDICGTQTRHVKFSFQINGKEYDIQKHIRANTNHLTHVYTVVINPDKTYEIRVDDRIKASGNLMDDFNFIPPETIDDPSDKKPSDWVDDPMIPDPEDVMPEDWDEEENGPFVPRWIDNPEFKGVWKPRQIPNPEYQAMVRNGGVSSLDIDLDVIGKLRAHHVGFELWQVKAGTVFDNIVVGDDLQEVIEFGAEHWTEPQQELERIMWEQKDQERKEEMERLRKKIEEERKKQDEQMEEMQKGIDRSDDNVTAPSEEAIEETANVDSDATETAEETAEVVHEDL